MKRKLSVCWILLLVICCVITGATGDTNYTYTPTMNNGEVVPGSLTNYTHNHNFIPGRVTKEPTCTQTGTQEYNCNCGVSETRTLPAKGHSWGGWTVTKEATCGQTGTRTRKCSVCGQTETETIAKTNDHSWGGWTVTKEATCAQTGTRTRRCSVCGQTETDTIAKTDHSWGAWKTLEEATCTHKGKRQHRCAVCGVTETKELKKKPHEAGEWTTTKEPTCKKAGQREAACVHCGTKMTEKIPKVNHDYEAWETVKEATDFSKGKRQSACRFCGKKKTEEFYPEGTLAKDLENDPAAVKELQSVLGSMGLYSGAPSGDFDKKTVSAVKKLQKNLKHKQDGVGWPGLLKLLGLHGGLGDGITDDVSGYKLQLTVVQTSAKQSYYAVGDQLEYKWTLTNASKKNDAKNLNVAFFSGLLPSKKTDQVIDQPGTLPKGDSVSGTYTYTVTKKDALTGKFTFGFIARGKLGSSNVDSNKVCFVNAASAGKGGTGGWTPPVEELLSISKKVINTPKNGLFFLKGETIQFEITVKNTTSKDVKNVILTDKLLGEWKKTIGTLAGGDSRTYQVDYKAAAADVNQGEAVNTAVVSYTGADGKTRTSKATDKAPVAQDTDGLYIYKVDIASPANGLFYLPDEEVTFEITIANPTKRDFTELKIYDWLYSKKKAWKTESKLEAGKFVSYTFKTKVTKLQGKLGSLTNIVRVTYRDPEKADRVALSNECRVPCGLEGQDGVIVTKTVISTPENGLYYQDGEEIRYLIEVTNNTVRDIIAMDVRDSLAELDEKGYRTIHTGETLAAGATFSTHFSFVVGPYDVENTKVTNIASALWAINPDEFVETYSDPVIVPTAEVMAERKPKPVALEGNACASTLTAVGDGVTQRDLTECDEHTETAEKSEELVGEGSMTEARALWDEDIGKLYQEWKEASGGEGRRAAENEQASFGHQMDALDASLSLVCAEETAQTIAVEERMEKTVEMCYELHSAPETRPDSLKAAHSVLNKSNTGDECAHSVTYGEHGAARFLDDQCENHTMTMQLTQYLLDIAADEEDRENAWLRAQGNWLLELNSMYDTWYLSADAVQRVIIAADRMSFDELINARREALAEMYPDDPATAAEVLANMIMNRTLTMCRVLHDAGVLTD
ncbi:MAG: peptidoglycan-binding protein [Clostridia bacterium]|nr:peptidoglycan-binding protein [Clostridia bacterium]